MNGPLLLDNSAWARLNDPRVDDDRVAEIATALSAGEIWVCLPFVLEAGYSARHVGDHDRLMDLFRGMPWLHIDAEVESRAVQAQRQLARQGHHRLPPVDLLLAALADRHGAGILHFDRDFDLIAEHTGLRFASEWLAPPDTL